MQSFKELPMHKLGMAQRFMTQHPDGFHKSTLKKYDMNSGQWFVLGKIASATPTGGIRITNLASILKVKTTYITMICNDLRADGYVRALLDDHDHRARLMIITDKGNEKLQAIEKDISSVLEAVVTPEEFNQYMQTLEKLIGL